MFSILDNELEITVKQEVIRVSPWGANSMRVRVAQHKIINDLPHALLPSVPMESKILIQEDVAEVINGDLTVRAEVTSKDTGRYVALSFIRTNTGEEILTEQRAHFWWPGARLYISDGNGYGRLEQRFEAYEGEKIFGLGQRTHGKLDQKGLVLDLVQRNAEVSIPFFISSRGYGFLWNSPAVGRVEFAENGTRWVSDSARQIDYWVTAGDTPVHILSQYADATGHAPVLPEWATGFWQCKLRYKTQEELLNVAREHKRRGLPMSVIVSDFFHWTHLGDWKFDPAEWPDPDAMVSELDSLGIKLMVSIWPSVSPLSENYLEMLNKDLLVGTESGVPHLAPWKDKGMETEMPVAFYDSTNPAARDFIWSKVKENYFDKGINVFWLDADEPEIQPGHPHNTQFNSGPGNEVFNVYPRDHAQGFYENMHANGNTEVVLLSRSAWAGSQRYGQAVWSGDIPATWSSLQASLRAGLNIAVSGIPWWTTDIGGFHGGDPDSPEYRELVARWFQYGVFCPLFRFHGFREPQLPLGTDMTGGPNEVWSYGEETLELITQSLFLRERIRPYVQEQMQVAADTGMPPMRPVFVDFSSDAKAWDVDDQFLLGPDLLVAPVLTADTTERSVYLPAGTSWINAWTEDVFAGGQTILVDAPLDRIPVFVKSGASVNIR
jgi:alpha-D-xyloside xylohydrolase